MGWAYLLEMTDSVEEINRYWFKAKYLMEKNEPITVIKPDTARVTQAKASLQGASLS